jgi:hypothetical protein
MSEHKPDKSLIHTPVEEVCGDPKTRRHPGQASEVYGLKGPEGVSEGLGADPVLLYEDITPNKSEDRPSDAKRFKGVSDEV